MQKVKNERMVQVQCRITQGRYDYFMTLVSKSNGLTLSKVLRDILENKTVKLRYENVALDQVMHQLALMYRETHKIGVNINQVTKEFHQSKHSIQKFLLGKKMIELQLAVMHEIEALKPLLAELQHRWLSE